ncbi:MAG: hypothetical protein ACREHF_11110 [Rhizomicrobium sp.]
MRRKTLLVRKARFLQWMVVGVLCASIAACATGPRVAIQQPAPKVALPHTPPPGEPADLAGLQSAQLVVAFGAPAFVRKDGAVETWRYDGPGCKAFFFLYPYGNVLLVRHVETLPRGRDMAADRQCLDSLRTHTPAPAS